MASRHVRGNRCQRCKSVLEPEDLRCPLCALRTPPHEHSGDKSRAQVLRCGECGAAISYSAEQQAPMCVFCGSVMHLEEPADPVEQAQFYLPFTAFPETAQNALRRWMSGLGVFRPSDLVESSTIQSLRPLWWAAWTVNARASVSWTADSDSGAHRSEWAPHAGQTPLELANLVISASRGLSLDETRALVRHYDLSSVRAEPHGPAKAVVEQFELQRSAARDLIANAIEATASARMQAEWIPGHRFRNVKVSVLLRELSTSRFALPAYVLAYRYRGRLYRAIVHGQDARRVFGQAPLSWAKISLVVALAVGALALIVWLLGIVLDLWG